MFSMVLLHLILSLSIRVIVVAIITVRRYASAVFGVIMHLSFEHR